MHAEKFTYAGNEYEVRVISDGHSIYARVFAQGRPANGYRYEATLETVHDAEKIADLDVVKHLIKTAKADISK